MRRNQTILLILFALLVASIVAGMFLGASGLSPAALLEALISGDRESAASRIFMYVRLPRILAALLSGSALSTAGFLLQSVLRNPLAAPSVIGINSGAGLGALICMAAFPGFVRFMPAAAFLGACAAAFAVYLLAQQTPLMLLDEPTTYLDLAAQFSLMQLLKGLCREGRSAVVVLHDLALALEYADRVLLLQDGRLIASGTPESVCASGKIQAVFGVCVSRLESGQYVFSPATQEVQS